MASSQQACCIEDLLLVGDEDRVKPVGTESWFSRAAELAALRLVRRLRISSDNNENAKCRYNIIQCPIRCQFMVDRT